MNQSEQIDQLATALAAAQGEFQREMDKAQKAWEKAEKDQIKEGVAA